MKNTIIIVFSLFMISCDANTKDSAVLNQNYLNGTWIESFPEMFDGISDTLLFTQNRVWKHSIFDSYYYSLSDDSITFYLNTLSRSFHVTILSQNEMIYHNFLDQSITSQVKDIHFTKLK